MPFTFADSAYVMRSHNKDDYYLHRLASNVQDVCAKFFGARFMNTYDRHIEALGMALYYFATIGLGKQTIGEEYTDLLAVSSAMRLPSTIRRLWFVIFCGAYNEVARRVIARYWPAVNASDLLEHVSRLHIGIFFLAGAYVTLSHRAAGLRYMTMSVRQPVASSYQFLGLLILVEYCIRGIKVLRERSTSRVARPSQANVTYTAVQDEEEEDAEGPNGKCTLCLGGRKMPTATSCGHIFCWHCIVNHCSASGTHGAQCPLCRSQITLSSLVPLLNFAVSSTSSDAAKSK